MMHDHHRELLQLHEALKTSSPHSFSFFSPKVSGLADARSWMDILPPLEHWMTALSILALVNDHLTLFSVPYCSSSVCSIRRQWRIILLSQDRGPLNSERPASPQLAWYRRPTRILAMSGLILFAGFVSLMPCVVSSVIPSDEIVLRNLAEPRFFGAAANTTFLLHDVAYTKLISTQVSTSFSIVSSPMACWIHLLKFSIFTAENESTPTYYLWSEKCIHEYVVSEMGKYRAGTERVRVFCAWRDRAIRWKRERESPRSQFRMVWFFKSIMAFEFCAWLVYVGEVNCRHGSTVHLLLRSWMTRLRTI